MPSGQNCLLFVCSAPTGEVLPWATMKIFASFSPNSTKSHLLETDHEALHYLKDRVMGRGTEIRKTQSELLLSFTNFERF